MTARWLSVVLAIGALACEAADPGPGGGDCPCPDGSFCDLATRTCVAGCALDEECPAGQACGADHACHQGCRGDDECGAGQRCRDRVCVDACAGVVCEDDGVACTTTSCRDG